MEMEFRESNTSHILQVRQHRHLTPRIPASSNHGVYDFHGFRPWTSALHFVTDYSTQQSNAEAVCCPIGTLYSTKIVSH